MNGIKLKGAKLKTRELHVLNKFGIVQSWVYENWKQKDNNSLDEYLFLSWLLNNFCFILTVACLTLYAASVHSMKSIVNPTPDQFESLVFGLVAAFAWFLVRNLKLARKISKLCKALDVSESHFLILDYSAAVELAKDKLTYAAALLQRAEVLLGINHPEVKKIRASFRWKYEVCGDFSLTKEMDPYFQAGAKIKIADADDEKLLRLKYA